MSRIIDARTVSTVTKRKILFDTNIWILIEGLDGPGGTSRQHIYSEAYRVLKENENVIVVNEYVLAEFCNRTARMDYGFAKEASGLGSDFMSYKAYRETEEFKHAVEVARDTCLNILDDCEFCSCYDKHFDIRSSVTEFADGKLDLSDIILRGYCETEAYALMTDDRDYASSNIDIITANRRILGQPAPKRR